MKNSFYNNDEVLLNQTDKNEKLKNKRQTALLINSLSAILSLWAFVLPHPYQIAMLSITVMPLIVLVAIKFMDSSQPSVIPALIFPTAVLAIRSVYDYSVLDYSNVWLLTVAVAVLLIMFLMIKRRKFSSKKIIDWTEVLGICLILFIYSFAAVLFINSYYDNSQLQHYTAEVSDKKINYGKSFLEYIMISPWGKQSESEEISVNPHLYKRLNVGSDVHIYLRDGVFNIPWFVISDREERHSYSWLISGRDKSGRKKKFALAL